MLRTLLQAVMAFVVCFATGNLIQVLLRYPTEQIRRNMFAGVVTSAVVALYIVIVQWTGWLR